MNRDIWVRGLLGLVAFTTGGTLLCLALGWKLGLGITMLVYWHKQIEHE